MKRLIFFVLSFIIVFLSPASVEAAELPIELDSGEWRLSIDVPEFDDNLCQPGQTDMYALKLENKSGAKENVTAHTFRKEDGKMHDYGLAIDEQDTLERAEFLDFSPLPVHDRAEDIEVLILWQEETDGRILKQSFTVPLQ